MGVPHTEKGKSLFNKLLPSTNLFTDYFQRFLKHLRKALTQAVPVYCLSSVCPITIRIPTVNARFNRDLSVTLSPPHTNTLGACQKWQQTPNTKSLSFSPKSTNEDCPTILSAGGSAGMSPSALVNFPSWKKRQRERERARERAREGEGRVRIMQFHKCSYILQILHCGLLFSSKVMNKPGWFKCSAKGDSCVQHEDVEQVWDWHNGSCTIMYFFHTGPRFAGPLMDHTEAVTKAGFFFYLCLCLKKPLTYMGKHFTVMSCIYTYIYYSCRIQKNPSTHSSSLYGPFQPLNHLKSGLSKLMW